MKVIGALWRHGGPSFQPNNEFIAVIHTTRLSFSSALISRFFDRSLIELVIDVVKIVESNVDSGLKS
jgi:hypothetical protein